MLQVTYLRNTQERREEEIKQETDLSWSRCGYDNRIPEDKTVFEARPSGKITIGSGK